MRAEARGRFLSATLKTQGRGSLRKPPSGRAFHIEIRLSTFITATSSDYHFGSHPRAFSLAATKSTFRASTKLLVASA